MLRRKEHNQKTKEPSSLSATDRCVESYRQAAFNLRINIIVSNTELTLRNKSNRGGDGQMLASGCLVTPELLDLCARVFSSVKWGDSPCLRGRYCGCLLNTCDVRQQSVSSVLSTQ